MTESARGVARPGPVRDLPVPQLEAESPVVRIHPAEVGQDSREPRELHGRGLGQRLGCDEARALQLASEEQQIVERAVEVRRRRAPQLGVHAQGFEHAGAQVFGERHLCSGGDVLRERLEPDIRVDAPLPRSTGRDTWLERKTGRVREQMPHGRALGPGGLIEIDRALFGRNERCQRGDELRHRGPTHRLITRAVRRDHLSVAHGTGRRDRRRPPVDLPKRIHSRAILVA